VNELYHGANALSFKFIFFRPVSLCGGDHYGHVGLQAFAAFEAFV